MKTCTGHKHRLGAGGWPLWVRSFKTIDSQDPRLGVSSECLLGILSFQSNDKSNGISWRSSVCRFNVEHMLLTTAARWHQVWLYCGLDAAPTRQCAGRPFVKKSRWSPDQRWPSLSGVQSGSWNLMSFVGRFWHSARSGTIRLFSSAVPITLTCQVDTEFGFMPG
jgi:hypothetical protein